MSIISKLSFKDKAFKMRETAILDATAQTLAEKGFDLMTMDDIANLVGISKPVLYKHFKSKEDLVGAAMIRLLKGASAYLKSLPEKEAAIDKLKALLVWALEARLKGGVPFLPSTSQHVRDMLMRNLHYVALVISLNKQLKKIVQEAKQKGQLKPDLPDDVILFSYYARTCDPTIDYLKSYSKMSDAEIVAHMVNVCFMGFQN